MFAANVDKSATLAFTAFIVGDIYPWTIGIYAAALRFDLSAAFAHGAFYMNIVFHFPVPSLLTS
jgi:hypothetical protein